MRTFLDDSLVALIKESPWYSTAPPYDPSEPYPEWPDARISQEENPAYRGVRDVLLQLGLDSWNARTRFWNPLGDLIRPGNTVVVKPNLVAHANIGARAFGVTDTDSLITHGSVLRAVIDYTAKALDGNGTIIVGDCPIQGTIWEKVVHLAGLPSIQHHIGQVFPGVRFRVQDYRLAAARTTAGWVSERLPTGRSLTEYLEVDLAEESLLAPLEGAGVASFGVSQYSKRRMRAAHSGGRNSYLISTDLLTPDVFINVPKLKAHQKAGLTCALKNLVGINGHKDYLPHFRYGSPRQGGDEFPDGNWLWNLMWGCYHMDWERDRGLIKRVFRLLSFLCAGAHRLSGAPRHSTWLGGGSWQGNDTIWRTVLDLNRLFFYFDRSSGMLADKPREDIKYLVIADGLIGGEKESPLAPSPVSSGWLLGATNPLAVDAVAAACMGFDVDKIRLIREAFQIDGWPLASFGLQDIEISGNTGATRLEDIYRRHLYTPFEPSQGFRGAIEFQGFGARAVRPPDTAVLGVKA
jgi:uncharacterized protein (DUF362 family)